MTDASGPDPASPPAEAPLPTGVEVIRDHLRRLPARPGVYRMYADDGEPLYVGKARNLRARVSNYAKLGGHTQRIARMIQLTRSMEFVVTESEMEALLLEANLIKRLKPRFNIILRDDKTFPHILIREDHEAPQVLKHRGAKRTRGQYFGPFASAGAVDRTLDTLQKAFLLRTCTDSVYAARSRPCMLHQMGRCSAPCVGVVSLADYAALADQARRFLRGEADALQGQLSAEMEAAALRLDFETAARLRDRIRAIAAVRASQTINPDGVEEADVFAIHTDAGQACVQAFFFRVGQNWGATAYYPRCDREDAPEDVLAAFLAQFYDDRPPPRLILTSIAPASAALLTEALELRAGRRIEIRAPQRGEKRQIVEQAELNAREALARRLAETRSQETILAAVQKVFALPAPPRRIEVYDNSHIQGSNAVGGMIVAGPEGFEKTSYRKFNMKDAALEPGDDFAMMREVMRRRFSRLRKETEEAGARPASHPDLVLIDGGEGQLSAVMEALGEVGYGPGDLPVAAISKGPDRNAGREVFHRWGKPPFQLPQSDPALYYLQRLRDEAHRWAIGAHRAKRSADITRSPLDEIPGVGVARKKALLHRFGSARGVSRATLGDLMTVEGVNEALARRIHDHFHGG